MKAKSEKAQILDKSLALTALIIPAVNDYGFRILMLCAAAAAVSMFTELICLYLRKDPFRLRHLDAAVTGVILTMLMPPTVPLSLLIMSCIFAIIIGRQVFGGRDHLLFSPAAVGYCFAYINQKAAVTLYPAAKGTIALISPETSGNLAGISELWNHRSEFHANASDILLGMERQPIGTGSLLLLVTVTIVLIFRRSASGWAALPMLGVIVAGNLLFTWYHDPMPVVYAALLTNQAVISAVFLYGDPQLAPEGVGGMLYGVICGILCVSLTRILYVTDAPVMLAVLTAPFALVIRHLLEQAKAADAAKKGGASHDEASSSTLSSAE